MSLAPPPSDRRLATSPGVNVAARLTATARAMPEALAIVEARRPAARISFRELDETTDRIAGALHSLGVGRGTRIALLVPPSVDFVACVFALFKAGAVTILIDPGMGRANLIKCLEESRPEGFVAVPIAHAIRSVLRKRFPLARHNVTVGRRWFWGGPTLDEVRRHSPLTEPVRTQASDPAAIIFTTGSTGPPKGVLYRHGNFDAQVDQLREHFQIAPGEIDLACFPLFGLFNSALGVTTVIPHMDASRPAQVDPYKIVRAIDEWKVTQSFGSPAIWNRVGRHCEEHQVRLPTLRRVMSAGAPVPAHVLKRMKACIAADGEVHTPYGATEALPVASNTGTVVLGETIGKTNLGAGVCVGPRFSGINWRTIPITDAPITSLSDVPELPAGQIGELIVRGAVVTTEYVTRTDANAPAKIPDGDTFWHRMGDVGYFDGQGRFWFCGRMAHRVTTPQGVMFTIPCEAIFNTHPSVFRSALVGVGRPGEQQPVIVIEPQPGHMPESPVARTTFTQELRALAAANPLTTGIEGFLFHPSLPVDIRHNAKIFREELAVWAADRVKA